ncbi:MAG: hypothetical protein J6Q13_04230, partial [Clostridia bacterium]|nr:hypothetical protein [Clostridia bacterium]
MKKLLVFLLCFCSFFCLFGCESKKEDLSVLGENKTNYEIDINLNVSEKSAYVKQTIDYINETGSILKVLKLNLYPQFFEQGATHNIISSTKQANCYPNGMSYAEFEVDRVSVENKDVG